MKRLIFKSIITASAVAMICACGDDSASSNTAGSQDPNTPGATSLCSKAMVKSDAWILNAGDLYVIYPDNSVTDANGNAVGTLVDGSVVNEAGVSIVQTVVDLNSLEICAANVTVDPGTGDLVPVSSSSVEIPGGQSSSSKDPSAGPVDPDTPVDDPMAPTSSATVESSSSNVTLNPDGFPTIESYGPPSPEYTKDISATAKRGWNTRYWDACKPHCSWISDGDKGRTDTTTNESYIAGLTTARNCNIHDVEVPTFTLGNVTKYWFGYEGTNSACGSEKEKGVFTCTDMAPIAVNDTLSYGYVAGTADGKCGKCYHLQYDGHFEAESENNKPKATHQALKGKHMVVMASNIGMDVAGGNDKLPAGQFDLMVPGGGVGAYDALSVQVKGANVNWGAGFGGFLTECQNQLGYDNTLEAYQTCVKDMCDAAFGNAGFPNLLRGCHWFADWFMAADNPTYYIEEVECPQYLMDHYLTRINTTKDNNYKKVTDWSTYKEGDVLDTLHCWKAGEGPADENGWANPNAGCNPGE